ncbi:transketolase family protein [Calderihabitans maritimus]|uniref:Transketolase n=1 Tax=Calderihabitans maritimus TaxID=1246530 RepID=A0A1Z5HUZ5_9FIRM|nr:transketolase family protein [Calderihabitans maritimus]GAW93167.1 transketolase [Calderihabitans maritimus]
MAEKIATREAYGKTLVKLGAENKDIVVLDADLAKSTKTALFAREFPERFFDMGIAEQNMMGTAAGLATAGKIPFVSTFAVFATGRAFDQIRNSIAYPRLNVKIAASHAGITVGEDGASHQSVEDIALMRSLPGMTVIVPADAVETEQAVKAAVEYSGPVYIRLGRSAVPVIYDNRDYTFRIGKAHRLREGTDAAIMATGIMVSIALEAAEKLEKMGLQVQVVNISTIKPLDKEAVLEAARTTGAIVTAEEHNIIGGLGSAVAEVLVEAYPVPMERVGIKDSFGESGKPGELLEKYGLTAEHLVEAVVRVEKRKRQFAKR